MTPFALALVALQASAAETPWKPQRLIEGIRVLAPQPMDHLD